MSPPPVPLPIDAVLPQALAHLRRRRELVVVAPTGSGKTTRLPAALLDAGVAGEGDAVVVLEPRRLAARAAARFVAAERGGALGEEVGYHVRFDRKLGPRTRLRYVTEGLFLRALQADPFLEGVGAVVFDEFHERNLDGDLALALARRVQSEARADLALVVMSATLEAEPVARFLGDAPVVRSEGRSHPVEIEHRPPPSGTPEHEAAARAVRDELARPGGDLLVFLPGVGEIRRLELALADVERSVELVPLYGELDPARQDRALAAGERRRVVLATNVAETSVTVEGVDTVIDTGRVRLLRHDETSGLNRLVPERVSRASADQRAGRAGRLGPGRCVRLWSPWEERALPPVTEPEIRRGELSGVVLELLAFGERDPQAFPWFEAPRPRALESATALLASLGAVRAGTLTELGRRMQRLPVAPRLARLLVEAESLGVLERGALAAALLSERSPFERDWTPQVRAASSDVLERVEVLEAFERGGRPRSFGLRGFREGRARAVLAVRDALLRTLRAAHGGGKAGRHPEARDPDVALGRALFVAFADRLARRREAGSPRAVAIDGRGVQLDPESVVTEAELFVCLERRSAAGGPRARGDARVSLASAVERAWLDEDGHAEEREHRFEPRRERVELCRRRVWYGLALGEVIEAAERDGATAAALCAAARQAPERALDLEHPALLALTRRLAFLADACPELELPRFGTDELVALLPELCHGRRSFAELRALDLAALLRARLGHRQLALLDREAPERLELPGGGHRRLEYRDDGPPILAARIQQLFGLRATPRLARGRVPVLLHLLAPNGRPQQVTDDLAGFWERTYPVVRKELRGRYPKHAWPERPP